MCSDKKPTNKRVFIHRKSNRIMVTCEKCDNDHHDQCMGKAGMFDCDCKCFK